MARRKKAVAPVAVEPAPEMVDVSKLGYYQLVELANKARMRDAEKYRIEQEEENKKRVIEKEKFLTSKGIKTLQDKVKNLRKKFEGLPTELTVKMNVPIEVTLNLASGEDFNYLLSEAMDGYVEMESLFGEWSLELSLSGNGGLDRIQKPLVEEALSNYNDSEMNNHCHKVFELFPDHRKAFRGIVDEFKDVAHDISDKMNEHDLDFDDIVE